MKQPSNCLLTASAHFIESSGAHPAATKHTQIRIFIYPQILHSVHRGPAMVRGNHFCRDIIL